MKFTPRYLLPESIWDVNDTPMNLQYGEEWLITILKRGRYGENYIIKTVTINTGIHPDGSRGGLLSSNGFRHVWDVRRGQTLRWSQR